MDSMRFGFLERTDFEALPRPKDGGDFEGGGNAFEDGGEGVAAKRGGRDERSNKRDGKGASKTGERSGAEDGS